MSLWTHCMGTILLTGACLGAARAAEFDVGRASVVFPTDDWSVADLEDPGEKYGGDRKGVIASETKIFVKTAAQGEVEAVTVVRGSHAGVPGVYMTYSGHCDPTEEVFAEGNTGPALRISSCLKVYPRYTTQSLLKHLGEAGSAALEARKSRLPEAMHVITSTYGNSNGTFVSVEVWLAPGFDGSPGTVSEALPKDVPASHVVWGRALNSAVRSSVTSIFGTLKFPTLSFKLTSPAPRQNNVALNTLPSH